MNVLKLAHYLGAKQAAADYGMGDDTEDDSPAVAEFVQELNDTVDGTGDGAIKDEKKRTDDPLWSAPVGIGSGDSFERGVDSAGMPDYGGV